MKYELVPFGDSYRVKALKKLPNVKIGDLGGFVEGPDNLSHEGNCWIFPGAGAYNRSRVIDNAVMRDDSAAWDFSLVSGGGVMSGESAIFDYSECSGMMKGDSELHDRAYLGAIATMSSGDLYGYQASLISPAYFCFLVCGTKITVSDRHIAIGGYVHSIRAGALIPSTVHCGQRVSDLAKIISIAQAHFKHVDNIISRGSF